MVLLVVGTTSQPVMTAAVHDDENHQSGPSVVQRRLLAGSIAGCMEVSITMPFETAKTRMQFEKPLEVGVRQQGVGLLSQRMGMIQTFRHIVACEGPRGLYYGLPICLVQSGVKNALRFTLFEHSKTWLRASAGWLSPGQEIFLAGACAGTVEAAIWVTPTERLKTLRHTQIGISARHQPPAGPAHHPWMPKYSGWVSTLRTVVSEDGVRSLFAGTFPTVVRNAGTLAARFMLYERIMELCRAWSGQKHSWHSLLCGGVAGTITTAMCVHSPGHSLTCMYAAACRAACELITVQLIYHFQICSV